MPAAQPVYKRVSTSFLPEAAASEKRWLTKRRVILLSALAVLVVLIVVCWKVFFANLGLSRGFDPDRMGTSEAHMWQSYYEKDHMALASEMIALMREQMGASLPTAIFVVWPMAEAASAFASGASDYEQIILPRMELAFARLARATGEDWDPRLLAEAELAWWVARRTPGHNSPEEVGTAIARVYTLIYGNTNEFVTRAGILRAQAAYLRDTAGTQADWDLIESLLQQSYAELLEGVQLPPE